MRSCPVVIDEAFIFPAGWLTYTVMRFVSTYFGPCGTLTIEEM